MKDFILKSATSCLLVLGVAGCGQSTDPQGVLDWASVAGVAQSITRNEDQVAVKDLADWIIQETGDFVLIDVRDAAAFEAGHIKTARSQPLMDLLSAEAVGKLGTAGRIVLYSHDSAAAAQAAAVLRLAGLDAYSLDGGYDGWLQYMTDPDAAGDAYAQARRKAVQCYFEGDYVAAAGLMVKAPTTAAFTPPLTPVKQAPAPTGDPLGLGLGLGIAPAPTPPAAAAPVADPLGLGLGLGDAAPPATQPAAGAGLGLGGGAPAGLKIGEGC